MKHPFSTFLSVCLAITMIMGSVFGLGITAQDTVTLRVGWFYQPGYQEIDDNGQPSGYNYEYLQEISRHNNWSYEFVTKDNQNQELSWESSLEMLKKGQLD